MKIELKINTIVYADENKLLKRKSDGTIIGKSVQLGYNYYDAGLLLNKPRLSKSEDFEEIDQPVYEKLDSPENYEEVTTSQTYDDFVYKVDLPKRLKRISEILLDIKKEINSYNLTEEEAFAAKLFFPNYDDVVDNDMKIGDRFIYKNDLYEVLLNTRILKHYEPSENTVNLYKKLTLISK